MKEGDYINIEKLNFDEFIKLHQILEDRGYNMYADTKSRIASGCKIGYENLAWSHDGICGSSDSYRCKNELPISNFLNQETSYEIY